ncbi:MAG: MarR family transcriptional regulator [Rhodanobacter sp.]
MDTDSRIPTPPKESLGVLIGLVRAEIVRALEAEMTGRGINLRFTQFLIIKRLARLGPMRAGELARVVDLDCGAMTRQLDQLEHKGYLRRCPHAQDRRTLRIELTAAGDALWQQLGDCQQRVLKTAQRSLDASERAQLHDYLERVLHALRDKA